VAPTVVSPVQPPPPPVLNPELPTVVSPPQAGHHDPSAFAPTVVTPVPDFKQPPPWQEPKAPPQPEGQTTKPNEIASERLGQATPQSTPQPPLPPPPGPGAHGGPPPAERTMVMSSSPVASPPKRAKLNLIMEGGETGETYDLRPTETVIGRVDGDIRFPHDGYMSGRHARVIQRNGHFYLIDNNSRNGTFIKIHQEVELQPGDVLLVGKQLFRFEVDE
jgi:hypothetical protein